MSEYEEDFEADDEGPVEDAEAKEKKSPSPSVENQRQEKDRQLGDKDTTLSCCSSGLMPSPSHSL